MMILQHLQLRSTTEELSGTHATWAGVAQTFMLGAMGQRGTSLCRVGPSHMTHMRHMGSNTHVNECNKMSALAQVYRTSYVCVSHFIHA